jgi:hypothetical protein
VRRKRLLRTRVNKGKKKCRDVAALGPSMTPGERESFARGFFAPEYVRETMQLSCLRALMMENDEDEGRRTHSGRGPTGHELFRFLLRF